MTRFEILNRRMHLSEKMASIYLYKFKFSEPLYKVEREHSQKVILRHVNLSTKKNRRVISRSVQYIDVDSIIAHRSPDCLRYFIPKSMGYQPQDNATYQKSLRQLHAIFHNFSCTINDLLEDKEANRICLYLSARGDTMAGEYVNEYMWLLDFDESGEKITRSKEYSDTILARDFFPKLKAAMTERRSQAAGQGATLGGWKPDPWVL